MLAGQVAVDDDGKVVAPGDPGAQAERIFEIVDGVLAAHGARFDDVLHIRTFMTDLADLPAYAAVRRRIFPGTPPPASTTVEISKLFLPGAVLEVEVTAVVRSRWGSRRLRFPGRRRGLPTAPARTTRASLRTASGSSASRPSDG
ncbi:RidA family protein [Micromonospora echinospora]|uniref:RidA family protein n=1 Tax=Micromonospora echinospora TaxID=1877 RepID=UPI003CF9351E